MTWAMAYSTCVEPMLYMRQGLDRGSVCHKGGSVGVRITGEGFGILVREGEAEDWKCDRLDMNVAC